MVKRCALIGLGMVAPTHVAALRASERVALSGIWGRDPDKASAFAQTHEVAQVYPDLAALAADEALDFVIVTTPPNARVDLVERLVAAGRPILMEKPIERNYAAAQQIVALCEAASVPLGIVLQHRARAASRHLKTAIDTGTLGDVTNVEIRVPWWRDQAYYDAPGRGTYARDGGGVMITQAIHTLDLVLWLLGPVAQVQALMHRTPMHDLEAEDWAGALLRFDSGAIGTMMATTAAFPGTAESLTVQGTKAAAHLAEGVLTLHHLDGRVETIGASAATGGGADPMAFTHDWHQAVIEDFAESLDTGRAPLASGRDALRAHAVIDAMETASKSGRTTEVTR